MNERKQTRQVWSDVRGEYVTATVRPLAELEADRKAQPCITPGLWGATSYHRMHGTCLEFFAPTPIPS